MKSSSIGSAVNLNWMTDFLPFLFCVDGGNRVLASMAWRHDGEAGIWGKEERDGRHRNSLRKEEGDGRRQYKRRDSESSSFGFLDDYLNRSTKRFALSISNIVEKYNFPFEDDKLISIKSLMYDTPDGPKAWGEESEEESMNDSNEASQNLPEEGQSMNSYEESPSGTDFKNNSEMSSVKRYLENMHLKDTIVYHSGADIDMLVNDDAYTVSESPMILRTETKNVPEESSFQKLLNESLYGYHAVVPRKQGHNGYSESVSLQLYKSTATDSADEKVVSGNLSLRDSEKTGCSSVLETYESADEHCSWNNITIVDLYPEMVKTLSRLMHKMPHKASSRSQIKPFGYGHWHPKKTKFNRATEKVRKFRPLKPNSALAITKENGRCKLPMENSGSNKLLGHSNYQMRHTLFSESSRTSPAYHNTDEMKMNSPHTEEDYSYVKGVGQNGIGDSIFPNSLSGRKKFGLKSPSWIPSSSDHVRKGQHFEEHSAVCPDDPGATFDLTEGAETGVTRIMSFRAPSYLNLPLNSNTNPHLQAKSSPVKSPHRLLRNHEIKIFPTAGSLRRSKSFSQFLVNHSRIRVQQKSEDAFEKMYKELCCPQLQKLFKSSNKCTKPTQSSDKLLKPELSDWTRFHQKHNKSGNMYVRSCSEGFPKISTFLRAARLKKYEGVQVSHTVNALVNSPVRTLPTVARSKRTANFSHEDFLASPVKRLKNISESFTSRIHQKQPDWENINPDKSGMTLTWHSPNSNNWSSKKLDSGFCISSNRTFLVGQSTYMHESGISDDYECIPKLWQSFDALKRMQNCSRRVSKKLNYNEGRARDAYTDELVYKDYQRSFSEGSGDEMS